ncbi:DNA topoisomerase 2 [Tenacibaculum phage pT24]|uniref:DNA topoisomerase (ATP-hydrolyzing) n=1 Tax=Tenacibaculum phage pT24 TaxID=1880590 RepID=A0A1B4X9B3_9CAUD|nr:DNA topoisomerase II large subunit [Tenacibaculum phage pT24]BAV31393.1 DNA topoisomerase 2 [Tenacibaculum phage pT24]
MSKNYTDKVKTLTELERIKIRPQIYIGSTVPVERQTHVLNDSDNTFEPKTLEYTPAILKLCDEVLTNSIDERIRNVQEFEKTPKSKQKNVNVIDHIIVDATEDGKVTVTDNGGIPVEFHPVNKCYTPQMIFGEIGTGTNYDDTADRNVAGLNGLGSKLANIFSKEFYIKTCDGVSQYEQTWRNGLIDIESPTITTRAKKAYKKQAIAFIGSKYEKKIPVKVVNGDIGKRGTTVSFKIDMSYFDGETLSYGVLKLLERKCILGAATNIGLKVTFNGKDYKFDSFNEYVEMYGHETVFYGKSKNWEYAIGVVPMNQGNYNYSIVNSAECSSGEHVSHANHILRNHLKAFMAKNHKMDFTNDNISSQYVLYLNVVVNKPTYETQTKEKLITPRNNFDGKNGGKPSISSSVLKDIEKSDIIKNLIQLHKEKTSSEDSKAIKKQDALNKKKSVRSIEKLVDATSVTGRSKCALWIFEGLSAGNSFISARNSKIHGSYTLTGKIKNLYGLPKSAIASNAVLNDIAMALGITYGKKIDVSKLRYGKIVIAVDADVDGISICAQLITFFMIVAPEIVEAGMLYIVNSPLYKLYNGKTEKYLYSQEDFDKASKRGFKVEYFKGLGSLGAKEYRQMVENPKLIQLVADDEAMDSIKLWMAKQTKDYNAPMYRKQAMDVILNK